MNCQRTSLIWVAAALLSPLSFSTPAQADVPNDPPSVSITSPTDGQMFDGPVATIDVVLEAFGGDEGINSVRLLVDDTPVLIDNDMPWGFTGVEIDEGMHMLVAVAVSALDGGEYESAPVEIVVLGAAGDTGGSSGSDSSGSGTSGSGSSAGESSGGTGMEPKKGCNVTSGTEIGTALTFAFCLFALSFVGRPRED